VAFSETENPHFLTFREGGRSQWVDATLTLNLLIGVCDTDFVRRCKFKQIKSPGQVLVESGRTD
jgi:hypothetical protein